MARRAAGSALQARWAEEAQPPDQANAVAELQYEKVPINYENYESMGYILGRVTIPTEDQVQNSSGGGNGGSFGGYGGGVGGLSGGGYSGGVGGLSGGLGGLGGGGYVGPRARSF